MTLTSTDSFVAQFRGLFTRTVFRLEIFDYYVAANEQEPFRRFQAGLPDDLRWRESWKGLITDIRDADKTISRVHVVPEPLTPYLRFELNRSYPTSVKAGEDIRILPRRDPVVDQLPDHDFWLFDDRTVALMHYDDQGNWLGVDLTEDPHIASEHCAWRDIAMAAAVPLFRYLDVSGETA